MPPNFVFFLIDDLGCTDLGAFGSGFYETPNLDRLCGEGLKFTDAYASCPVCSPTRASVLSGKYPARVGVTQYIGGHATGKLCDVPYFHQLPESEYSLARALKDGGYQTWHVGKWHLGADRCLPQFHGFDENRGGYNWGRPKHGYFSPYNIPGFENGPDGEYLTDRLTDEALQLLEYADRDRPFFLNFWHYTVHTPIQAKEAHIEHFRQKAADLGLDQKDPFEEGETFPCNHKRNQRVLRRRFQSNPVYAAMLRSLDENVGRLIDYLDRNGLRDDTVIVFSSDNGGLATAEGSPTCNAPMAEGKGWMYEGGNRVPQFMIAPRLTQPGQSTGVPVTSTDFYPTLLELAGLDPLPHQHCDGVSLVPLLKGADALERDAIFWHYPHYGNQGDTPACAIRAGDYKLIEHFEDGRLELYNLAEDVSETYNLADAQPERVRALHDQLRQWQASVQAPFPQPNPTWKPQVATN
ncbi:MAG: sulfatase [Opitutales bacterium]